MRVPSPQLVVVNGEKLRGELSLVANDYCTPLFTLAGASKKVQLQTSKKLHFSPTLE